MAIKQSIKITTTPEQLYKTLLSGKEFSKFTGAPAEIAGGEGGAFSCFGGQITGRHIELSPNSRVVQAWRAAPWPDGVYSIVKIDISKSGAATTVDLEQSGYPDGAEEHLDAGWHKMYWEPLKAYLS
jgi:activator of HSP90 ATPase